MRLPISLIAMIAPTATLADSLAIVTDIAPIHSLVAQVAGPDANLSVLVSGGASPHDFQFSFSQADAVQSADLVIWAGPQLTPWLDEALATLAPDAPQLTLLESPDWPTLALRDWDDGHDHGGHEDHDHEDHNDHADHDDHDEHDQHDEHEGHSDDKAAIDPHGWLDPIVAVAWVGAITDALIAADPENEATYRANSAAAIEQLYQLDQDIALRTSDLPSRGPLLVPHDAYQYFGARYDLAASAAISLSDAAAPSPAKIAELQSTVQDMGVVCVLSDPQSREAWVDLVREGSDARTALADPIGTAFPIGPDHYGQTLRAMADAYVDCLGG